MFSSRSFQSFPSIKTCPYTHNTFTWCSYFSSWPTRLSAAAARRSWRTGCTSWQRRWSRSRRCWRLWARRKARWSSSWSVWNNSWRARREVKVEGRPSTWAVWKDQVRWLSGRETTSLAFKTKNNSVLKDLTVDLWCFCFMMNLQGRDKETLQFFSVIRRVQECTAKYARQPAPLTGSGKLS